MTKEQRENYDYNFGLEGLSREEKIARLKERHTKLLAEMEIIENTMEVIGEYLQKLYYEKST